MTSPKIGPRASYKRLIARKEKEGYELCVIYTTDMPGLKDDHLCMWKKMADGKPDWIVIGPLDAEKEEFLIDRGKTLVTPIDENGMPRGLPVALLEPARPPTRFPDWQAPPSLMDELMHYKANGYVFRPMKKGNTLHLKVYRRGDDSKKIDMGPYGGPIEKMCEELDIDVADIRWLKKNGWHFMVSPRGYLIARLMKDGKRPPKYLGIYEGPLKKLCEKYGVDVKGKQKHSS